jgi:outer membrane protein assembly factor BamB
MQRAREKAPVDLLRVAAFVSVVFAIFTLATPGASARGQQSYRLSERVVAVPAPQRPAQQAAWSAPIDPQNSQGSILALTPEYVAFSSRNRICAFARAGGGRRWCSERGASPVEAKGVIAFLDEHGGVHAVDARTGRSRWYSAFGAGRVQPSVPISGSAQLWSTGSSFLVAGTMVHSTSTPRFGEVSLSGTTLWQRPLTGVSDAPFVANGYALVRLANSGATINILVRIVRLGPHGGDGMIMSDAALVLGTWRGNAVVVGGAFEPYSDETFLHREIELVTIPGGRIVQDRILEPDYEANRAASTAPGTTANGDVTAFEDGYVYASFIGNVYRYDLRGRDDQRPLLLSARTPVVGGPVRGTVYVARRDGVWALTPERGGITSRLVVATASRAVAFAARWPYAYMGFADGTLRGVDVRDGGTVLSGDGCVANRIVADARNAFFVCGGDTWRLLAFTNPSR